MSLWGGILAFLRFIIPSFLFNGRVDEKSSEFERKRKVETKETVKVSDNTVNSVPAHRNLLCNDSAYDTLHSSFSPNSSVNRGDKSESSGANFVDKSIYESKSPSYRSPDTINECLTPANTKYRMGFSDHVTPRYESKEDSSSLNFRDSREFKQQDFAACSFGHNNLKPEFNLGKDSEMKINFHNNKSEFSDRPHFTKTFRKHKEPDIYNGENVEWPDYVCHFEQVSLWNEWTDGEKATQLAMCLRGRAQRVLSELTNRELNNYFELKSALTQRFCPSERETAYRCDFRNRRRKSGESVADYGYSLRRLASRAFPAFPLDMRESLTVEQFVTGLGSQELKRYVQFSHPTSLDRAISLALEFESFEGSQETLRKPRDTEKLSYPQCSALIPPERNDSSNHLSKDLEKSIERMIQKTLSSYMNRNPDNQTRQPTTRKNVKCFTCKESGHISKNCPQNQIKTSQSKTESHTGNQNDSRHLNQNGLRSRPQAQPHQNH